MIAKLTQLFRFFLVVYLVGSCLLILLLLGLQYYQAAERSQWQLRQYAALLNVSLRPALAQRSAEQLTSQLLELHYSTSFPIAALGVYYPSGEPLASAGLSHLLPTHLAVTPVNQFQFKQLGSREAAIQPFTDTTSKIEPLISYQPEGYLVLVPDEIADKQPFWLLTSLVWLLYSGIFAAIAGYLYLCGQRRQAWLTGLLQSSDISGEGKAEALSQRNTPVEFGALQERFLQLVDSLTAERQLQQVQSTELQRLRLKIDSLSEQQQYSARQEVVFQTELQQWLKHTQVIWQRREQLPAPVFFALMRLQLCYGLYHFNPPAIEYPALQPSEWLAHHIPLLNELLPQGVNIDWLEGLANSTVALGLDSTLLEAMLQALLLLAQRSDHLTRLTVQFSVETAASPHLLIHLSCDGQGLAPDLNAQLKAPEVSNWQWRDIDIVLLQHFASLLDAKLKIQSLEGLGLSITLQVPMQLTELPFVKKAGHILLLDQDSERLSRRLAALHALAIQVTGCNSRVELESLLNKSGVDLLLLMLPPQAPKHEWLTFIRQIQQRLPLQVFAPAEQLAQWQALIPCHAAAEFSFALINRQLQRAAGHAAVKNLLVVDDNETNQAFIRILLQHKAVNFQAALTGAEVLPLCQQQQFDLILLDISLPDISGVEVARQLRKLPGYQNTPILAFTAHALAAEIEEFKLAGMNDILLKPLDPSKFETLLARYQLY